MPSILSKAFSGNSKPASELLARVKSEREKAAAAPTSTKRGKAVAGKK
jgi:hypothetical protein